MALNFVDIREVWDTVKVGLEQVSSDISADWRVEDVYADCVNAKAHILMDFARTPMGFVVVRTEAIPFSKSVKLLIWIAFDPVEHSIATYSEELETLARDTGHTQIEFLSPHKGLWSRAENLGYHLQWAVLNKKL